MAETSANPRNFVGGHASAYPASADQDATFRITSKDTQCKRLSIIRIIHRLGVVRADVHYLMAILFQMPGQYLLEFKASVIGADCDSHGYFLVSRPLKPDFTILFELTALRAGLLSLVPSGLKSVFRLKMGLIIGNPSGLILQRSGRDANRW